MSLLYIVKGDRPNAANGESAAVRYCCELPGGREVMVEDPDGYNLRKVPKKSLTPISTSEAKAKGYLKSRKQLESESAQAARRNKW